MSVVYNVTTDICFGAIICFLIEKCYQVHIHNIESPID